MRKKCSLVPGVLATVLLIMSPGPCDASRPAHMEYPVKLMNLETGYVLGNGQSTRIGIGDSGFGVNGIVQFTTNTMFDLVTFLNGQIKIRLMPEDWGLASLSVGAAYYNLASAQYITEILVEEAFTEEEAEIESGLDMFYFFVSASRRIGPILRFHAGYQHRYINNNIQTVEPIELEDDGETMGVELELDQSASQNCILFGADIDFLDHLKMMLELGYDFSYERARGGAGVRLGVGGSFALQLGILWPGIELDEDIDIPVLPHFSMFWRF